MTSCLGCGLFTCSMLRPRCAHGVSISQHHRGTGVLSSLGGHECGNSQHFRVSECSAELCAEACITHRADGRQVRICELAEQPSRGHVIQVDRMQSGPREVLRDVPELSQPRTYHVCGTSTHEGTCKWAAVNWSAHLPQTKIRSKGSFGSHSALKGVRCLQVHHNNSVRVVLAHRNAR